MPKGLVGVISNDSARYSLFWNCMMNLRMTEEAHLEQLIGGDWCGARNRLCELALVDGYDWLWFMDDDHAFGPDLLNRLLRHELPLVVPVCLTRVPPFRPVTFVERQPDQEFQYLPIHLPEQAEEGVVELEAGGCAGMLIRREVLEAIEPPWFEYASRSEDIIFCEKAKEAGFSIHCDLEARLGHITAAVVWPTVREEEWAVGFTIGRDFTLVAPFEAREEVLA